MVLSVLLPVLGAELALLAYCIKREQEKPKSKQEKKPVPEIKYGWM